MNMLLAALRGQHVGLFAATDTAVALYRGMGFDGEPGGLGRVVGSRLSSRA